VRILTPGTSRHTVGRDGQFDRFEEGGAWGWVFSVRDFVSLTKGMVGARMILSRKRTIRKGMTLLLGAALVPVTAAATGTPIPHAVGPTPTPKPVRAIPTPRPATPIATATAVPPVAPSYLVLIVLDGGIPAYFNVSGIPHVRQLMQTGSVYRNAFAGILESETPSGHASITSGSQPRNNGILSFGWADSEGTKVNLFSLQKVRGGAMEQAMRQAPAPTIAGLVHKAHPQAKVVALSGYKYYAADALGGPNADVIMYYADGPNGRFIPAAIPGHMPPTGILNDPGLVLPSRKYPLGAGDHMAMKLAAMTFQKMRQQVTLINLPEFDWPLGHPRGASRDLTDATTLMRALDADLGMLEDTYRKAGVLNQTLFVLTADHGFAPLDHKVSHVIMNNAVTAAGTTILSDSYHTAGYAWVKDTRKDAQIAANIVAQRNPHVQSVYYRIPGAHGPVYIRASSPQLLLAPGADASNQYLLSTFNGPKGPDIVIFMDENSSLVAGGESTWKGDHGGADWEAQHVPLIVSGPGVKAGQVLDYPAPIWDIAPTVLSLMGIQPKGMQGVQLAGALKSPPAWMWTKQNAQGRVLWPVVSALTLESERELAAHL
jgi:type I phosphodiesterase/nucleotide pyrophosphatase